MVERLPPLKSVRKHTSACSLHKPISDCLTRRSIIILAMKIIETSGGALTNFEVLDLLRSRGVGKLASGSENKVFNFLEGSVACNQTREIVEKFVHECRKFDLANAEILNILNLRPKNEPELFTIIEDIGSDPPRMEDKAEELLETIAGILPPHPSAVKGANEESADGEEETELETETEPAPCTT